ncbi:MAG: hypothetical protein DPW18_12740 [Chloroflexi bacterium]|nr:hypothetical protein [Chloroflexota bacterium]MDL1941904.1 hypothetical protein [Chloroflexi bacterium CFX2]
MSDENGQALQPRTEVIALPPLKMVLVHAKDERENSLDAVIKTAAPQEKIQPQALKKIIAHLEKK